MRRAASLVLLLGAAFACGHVPQDLWAKTWHYARAWGVDPYLVAAVVWVESGYCPGAVGRVRWAWVSSCRGLGKGLRGLPWSGGPTPTGRFGP